MRLAIGRQIDARSGSGVERNWELMRNFDSLSEREILALAISLEEEDERVYADYAEGLRQEFAASAAVFDGMRGEESGHRRRLIELYQQRFGDHIPLIRRQDVKGFVTRKPVWLMRPLGLDTVRKQAATMEVESRRFYEKAAGRARRIRTSASCSTTWRRKSGRTKIAPKNWRRENLGTNARREEDEAESPAVCAADRAARSGGADGRIGIHAGAGVCGGDRHAEKRGRVSGGAGGVGRGGNQHGLCRSALRRWKPDGPGTPVGARAHMRADDGARRGRPHAAISDSGVSRGDDRGRGRGAGGTWADQLDSPSDIWIRLLFPRLSRWGLGGALVFITGILIGSA